VYPIRDEVVLKVKFKLLNKELSWVVGAQLVSLFGGFGIMKLLALNLGATGFGYFSLCLSVAAMISLLWYGPLDQIILRYWASGGQASKQVRFITFVGHFFGAIFICAGFVLVYIASLYFSDINLYEIISLALVMAIPRGFLGSSISICNAIRDRRSLFFLQFYDVSIRLLLLFVLKDNLTPKTAVIITIISAVVSVGYLVFRKFTVNNRELFSLMRELNVFNMIKSFPDSRKYLNYGFSFVLIGVFASTCNYADRWIIQYSLSLKDVGIYSGIAQIATAPLILVSTISTQFLSPLMFGEKSSKNLNWRWLFLTLGAIYVFMSLFFYVFSEKIILLFLSEEFLPYHNILPLLMFGLSFFYIAQLVFLNAQKNERPGIIKIPWMIRSFFVLAAGIVLAPMYGVWGVVVAVMIGSIIFLGSLVVIEQKYR
jgi:O-antigen/teichoic acid export membrane protein